MQCDGNLTETVWCVLVLSSLAKCRKISTRWKTAKKIMESERLCFFLFIYLYNSPLGVHLGGMTCIRLRETIRNGTDCTLLIASAEVHFLHTAWSVPVHFDSSPFSHYEAQWMFCQVLLSLVEITIFCYKIQLSQKNEKWLAGAGFSTSGG